MSDNDLYQELILDHYRNPRNNKKIEPHTHDAEGQNPLCGDELEIFINVVDGVIDDISFEAEGCAISQASASLMTESLKGKTLEEANAMYGKMHRVLTGADPVEGDELVELGKLEALGGVAEFPVRVKCASLAWHTMHAALENLQSTSTEEL